jgi:hypothetical protein
MYSMHSFKHVENEDKEGNNWTAMKIHGVLVDNVCDLVLDGRCITYRE